MSCKHKIGILAVIAVIVTAVFLFTDIRSSWDYVLPRRGEKLLAMILTGGAIAFSTLVFQTVTNNRILTPSIIGLDSLYVLIQTFLVFVFGSMNISVVNANVNFLLSTGLMVSFAGVLYKLLFQREGQHLYFLLLVGIIFGTFFESISSFLQVLIDPNEFLVVQDRMFASFNNVKGELLFIAVLVVLGLGLYFARYAKYLDVLSLGREHAVNLGIAYNHVVKRLLIVVAILVSVSTALVGPITFLGLLVVNVAYVFLKTYRHRYLIIGSIFISIIAVIGGQLLVERVFTFSTTLSVIINFVGGVYFIYLLLRERKA